MSLTLQRNHYHLRRAQKPNRHTAVADAVADVDPASGGVLAEAADVFSLIGVRYDWADKWQADLAAVGVAGKDEIGFL